MARIAVDPGEIRAETDSWEVESALLVMTR
jgi:hypothetical protein